MEPDYSDPWIIRSRMIHESQRSGYGGEVSPVVELLERSPVHADLQREVPDADSQPVGGQAVHAVAGGGTPPSAGVEGDGAIPLVGDDVRGVVPNRDGTAPICEAQGGAIREVIALVPIEPSPRGAEVGYGRELEIAHGYLTFWCYWVAPCRGLDGA